MNKFSKRSIENIETCHIDLQILFEKVLEGWDCSVICGHKNKSSPSIAVDVYPRPVPRSPSGLLNDSSRVWKEFMLYVKGVAAGMDIKIKCGGEFKGKMKNNWGRFELLTIPLSKRIANDTRRTCKNSS